MAGNTFGQAFRISTFGESHGPALGVIVDGCPAGLPLAVEDIQRDLERRKPGQSLLTTQRQESDRAEILSGVFEGLTTGTPIAMLVRNEDARSQDYSRIKDLFRPGHADFTYWKKYGRRDYRGGGRSSARETIGRVAAGAIARKLLARHGMSVVGYVTQIGPVKVVDKDLSAINHNALFSPDPNVVEAMTAVIKDAQAKKDSVGALVEVLARGVPAGLGEPVFDKLDADLAKAMMSINAVKGVEIGDGFGVVDLRGSENCDPITPNGFASNHAGGILGGISNGDEIVIRLALKPTSSIAIEQDTIDVRGNPAKIATKGRHDPCVGIRAVPIAEAMTALVLADHFLRDRTSRVDRL
ncbi:MAG: chorismate synthase [Nitrospirota bacterium]